MGNYLGPDGLVIVYNEGLKITAKVEFQNINVLITKIP